MLQHRLVAIGFISGLLECLAMTQHCVKSSKVQDQIEISGFKLSHYRTLRELDTPFFTASLSRSVNRTERSLKTFLSGRGGTSRAF
jgi:hypothetical protein